MEIKINKEIRSYKETVYFGLTARQLICSLLAVGTAVGLYFALRGVLDRETLGWLCIVGAAPMAAAGFFHYNGLTLERFLWAWCKTNFLLAGRRLWHSENYLYDLWDKEDKKGENYSRAAARSGTPSEFPAVCSSPFPSSAFIKTVSFR